LELLICDYGACAAVLVVEDAIRECTKEVAVGCLGRCKLDVRKSKSVRVVRGQGMADKGPGTDSQGKVAAIFFKILATCSCAKAAKLSTVQCPFAGDSGGVVMMNIPLEPSRVA
jgi:hypothetical protein